MMSSLDAIFLWAEKILGMRALGKIRDITVFIKKIWVYSRLSKTSSDKDSSIIINLKNCVRIPV